MRYATKAAVLVFVGLALTACETASTSTGVVLGKKVAFLVPDSTSGDFDTKDKPLFEAKLRSMCSNCEVIYGNANQDGATQQKQADSALAAGAGAIVLDPVDGAAGLGIIAKAVKAHVPVIAYNRLVMNTPNLKYFVGSDETAIGVIQATSLLKQLRGPASPSVVIINGDPEDPAALQRKKGAHSVLDGKVQVAAEYDVAFSSQGMARQDVTQALAPVNNKVDGVYAADDALASAAIAALKEAKVSPLPPVTGGDGRLQAIQRIVAGEQYMTVYKAVRQQAEAAATLAYELAYGVQVPASATGGKTMSNGAIEVPAVEIAPLEVTRKTLVSTVLAEGLFTRAEICTAEYAKACREAGIS